MLFRCWPSRKSQSKLDWPAVIVQPSAVLNALSSTPWVGGRIGGLPLTGRDGFSWLNLLFKSMVSSSSSTWKSGKCYFFIPILGVVNTAAASWFFWPVLSSAYPLAVLLLKLLLLRWRATLVDGRVIKSANDEEQCLTCDYYSWLLSSGSFWSWFLCNFWFETYKPDAVFF